MSLRVGIEHLVSLIRRGRPLLAAVTNRIKHFLTHCITRKAPHKLPLNKVSINTYASKLPQYVLLSGRQITRRFEQLPKPVTWIVATHSYFRCIENR
jgi:hypothetical protein